MSDILAGMEINWQAFPFTLSVMSALPNPPRYSSRPLPPYSYVPGQQPHPISDPAGHSHGHPPEPVQPLDESNWRTNQTWLWAIDLFNHGFYWEAHEAWEGLWHAAGRRGQTAEFLKGLIKLAAAGVKAREGPPRGNSAACGPRRRIAGALARQSALWRGRRSALGNRRAACGRRGPRVAGDPDPAGRADLIEHAIAGISGWFFACHVAGTLDYNILVATATYRRGFRLHFSNMHQTAPFRRLLAASLAAWVLALAVPPARGETFLLKSGGRIDGQQLNPGRGPTEPYLLRTDLGLKLSLTPAQVSRVVVRSDVQKQYDAEVLAAANTADGHWQLAEWCKEQGLVTERKAHLQRVLELDPDHEQARAALGFGRVGERWMTMDDVMLSLGYVRAGGVWKTPQQLELEVAARENELATKKLRRDILMWIDQLDGSRSESALANLRSVRDPRAGPTLVELLDDTKRPRDIRLLCSTCSPACRPD